MSSAAKGARRTLTGLAAIIAALYALLTLGVATHQTPFAPGYALDLAGGRAITLQASATDGSQIDPSDLKQAVEIIRKRIDATGTSEAEISTQGDRNIVVGLPGNPDEATLNLVKTSALLQFRPVLYVGSPAPLVNPSATPTPTPSATEGPAASPDTATGTATSDPSPTPSASALGGIDGTTAHEVAYEVPLAMTASPSPEPSAVATTEPTAAPTDGTATPTDPSDMAWITPEIEAAYAALDCTDEANLAGVPLGDPNGAFVTCGIEADGMSKLILGPVELTGNDVSTATAGPEVVPQTGAQTGRYQINLSLTGSGGNTFFDVTKRLAQLPSPRNQFGILLDGVVISHPQVSNAIPGGQAAIRGSFTLSEAQQLANQLKFGALPLKLTVFSDEHISATKGADDLRSGLIAGAIGLVLVVIYTMFQYRALGTVTIGSLLVAGGVTYVLIALMSWGIGYRLSLAGVTGLIVAIGITADSFIVYFERVKDELREGRSLQAAVEHGWKRARRTILASDAVSFLAALVLYMLAVGSVRGFAFTLGLTTLVDLVVVIMFTHPVLALLARTRFFGEGHRFSGLDPRQLGRDTMYKGRGRVATPSAPRAGGEAAPAGDGLTLAERKALKAKAAVATEDKE